MNIAHLNLFVRIATTHNISLAGKELGLSAAVSSAQMNKLEETLGVKLIHRTTRKVSLTEEGQAFLAPKNDRNCTTSPEILKCHPALGGVKALLNKKNI